MVVTLKGHTMILKDKNYFVCPEVVVLNLRKKEALKRYQRMRTVLKFKLLKTKIVFPSIDQQRFSILKVLKRFSPGASC